MKKVLLAVVLLGVVGLFYVGKSEVTKIYHASNYDGMDVSHHNGNIDFARVARDTNIKFVYVKATEGATYQDSNYPNNIKKIHSTRLKVGSYHFFRTTSTPKAQFENFKKVAIKKSQDLIPMVDVEAYTNKKGIHIGEYYAKNENQVKKVQDLLNKFFDLVEEHYGVKPMIYCNVEAYNCFLKKRFPEMKIYIGEYGPSPVVKKYTIWQYTEKGKVKGYDKMFDLCRFAEGVTMNDILIKRSK